MTIVSDSIEESLQLSSNLQAQDSQSAVPSGVVTVGADLRAARLAMGVDLAQVAQDLNVKEQHLRAIEKSDLDALPGQTYAIGFVRAYAEYVGLGAQECIRRFKVELTGEPLPIDGAIPRFEDERNPIPYAWVIVALVGIGFLATAIYFTSLELQREPDVIADEVPEAPIIESSTDVEVTLTPDDVFGEGKMSEEGLSPEDRIAQMTSNDGATGQISTGVEVEDIPDGYIWGHENTHSRLDLRARREVWIRLESEDAVLFEHVLQRGDRYLAPDLDQFILATRDAGAVDLFLDGNHIGRAGQDGETQLGVKLRIDAIVPVAPTVSEDVAPADSLDNRTPQ